MSCVWKAPKSPFWIAQFTDATGRRVNRSTKQLVKQKAEGVAATWERAALVARAGELTQAQSIKVLGDLMEITSGERLNVETIETYLKKWLQSRADMNRADSTGKRYGGVVESFLNSLPASRRAANVASVTAGEIERWRNLELKRGLKSTTADFGVRVLRAALNAARRKGLVLSNAAEAVESMEGVAEERDPFTGKDLTALLGAASQEWRGMILVGVWCGLRLADAASLTWGAIDLEGGTLTLTPEKTKRTGKTLAIAMHSELIAHFRTLEPGVGLAPLFPTLHGRGSGSGDGLSEEFAQIIATAGVKMRVIQKNAVAEGQKSAGRTFRSKGFHSLRHTMISRFADADVPADVRQAMAGHSSDKIHRKYTHLSLDTQRAAVAKLSGVGA